MNDFEEKVLETDGEFNEWFRKMVLESIRKVEIKMRRVSQKRMG